MHSHQAAAVEGHCPYPALPTAEPVAALGSRGEGAGIAALSSFAGTLLRNTHAQRTKYMGKAHEPQVLVTYLSTLPEWIFIHYFRHLEAEKGMYLWGMKLLLPLQDRKYFF